MSHVEYFNVTGYFNATQFVNDLGLREGVIGSYELTASERKKFDELCALAEKDSKAGKLDAVLALINTTEDYVEQYGTRPQCEHYKQATKEFINEIKQRSDLVRHFGLESFLSEVKVTTNTSRVQKKNRTK